MRVQYDDCEILVLLSLLLGTILALIASPDRSFPVLVATRGSNSGSDERLNPSLTVERLLLRMRLNEPKGLARDEFLRFRLFDGVTLSVVEDGAWEFDVTMRIFSMVSASLFIRLTICEVCFRRCLG